MDVRVVNSQGFEKDLLLSIRVGGVRRQAPIDTDRPLSFPKAPADGIPCRVDVLQVLATSQVDFCPKGENTCPVHFPTAPGQTARALTFQVHGYGGDGDSQNNASSLHASAMEKPSIAPQQMTSLTADQADLIKCGSVSGEKLAGSDAVPPAVAGETPAKAGVRAAELAQAYLDKFNLLRFVQDVLRYLVREKPDDPFASILMYLQEASLLPNGVDSACHRAGEWIDGFTRLRAELRELANLCTKHGQPVEAAAEDGNGAGTEKQVGPALASLAEYASDLRIKLTAALTNLQIYQPSNSIRKDHVEDDALSSSSALGDETPIVNNSKRNSWRAANFVMSEASIKRRDEADEHDTSDELQEEPRQILRKRGRGVSAEAYGAWNNRRAAFVPPISRKPANYIQGLLAAFEASPLFGHLEGDVIHTVVKTMPVEQYETKSCILKQGEDGDSLYVILSGAVECYDDSAKPPKFICRFTVGRMFGELAMLYNTPRTLSVYAAEDCVLSKLGRSVYQNVIVRHQMKERERREEVLRSMQVLETMNGSQVAQLADTLTLRRYDAGQIIVHQGEEGNEFFIVQDGCCSATVATGTTTHDGEGTADVQEHRRYYAGDLFGEQALLKRSTRAATVSAVTDVEVLSLHRDCFERLFGPLSVLQKQNYMTDPRMVITNFYQSGNQSGCRGSVQLQDPKLDLSNVAPEDRTEWFCVYRPTSRDAIAKMLSGAAVGKGLNVKGKSAKRGRISGFVPFLQINLNQHKKLIDPPQADARLKIFFRSDEMRMRMLKVFEPLLDPEDGVEIDGDRVIFFIDIYPDVYGLDVPEPLFYEVYVGRPDITFQAGWETGRKSEPAFQDMNFKAVRSQTEPKIVIYQHDNDDPQNPHGLLIAYAEKTVKPVVSDFDTFLVGSQNMKYDALPPEQEDLALWSIKNTEEIMINPAPGSWTTRWLEVIKKASEEGFHPKTPKFGFGDATSYRLISDVVKFTADTGAVRHGAECFNYFFPQELDDEFMVVWSGFQGTGWEYLDEDDLRDFLVERAGEGYVFPLNPVWVIRDYGWHAVLEALMGHEEGRKAIDWFWPSAVVDRVKAVHESVPEGFVPVQGGSGGPRKSALLDMSSGERAGLVIDEQGLSGSQKPGQKDPNKKLDKAQAEDRRFVTERPGDFLGCDVALGVNVDVSAESRGSAFEPSEGETFSRHASQCNCGNVFISDAKFCRMCGLKRDVKSAPKKGK